MSVASKLITIAENLQAKLDAINAKLIVKGQTKAANFDEIPAKVEAIETGSDVSGVTATADDVLVGKQFVDSTGTLIDGSMADNTAETITLSSSQTNYTIPAGKHSGSGVVQISIDTSNNTFTPTTSAQTKYAPSGKVWTSVSINAADIPTIEHMVAIVYTEGETKLVIPNVYREPIYFSLIDYGGSALPISISPYSEEKYIISVVYHRDGISDGKICNYIYTCKINDIYYSFNTSVSDLSNSNFDITYDINSATLTISIKDATGSHFRDTSKYVFDAIY